ncbi:MAG: right-handed parallel beta-helix repeat-containing protein [Phycisphaerales bacterium]|jgi:parallel beta-helix repeat protein
MKTRKIWYICLISLIITLPILKADADDVNPLPYMGQEPPGFEPKVFAPDFISLENRLDEYITFSPDGNECYFGTNNANWSLSKLYETHMENGTWTEPIRATATQGWGFNAIFPPTDAQRLYFVDERSPMPQNLDIFRVERNHGQWGEAIRLPAPINSSGTDWHPSFTTDGTMYFGSTRIDGAVYRVRPGQEHNPVVERVGIPCKAYEPAIAYDESFVIFHGDENIGYGNTDAFISFRNEDDTWTSARNLGPSINTEGFEYGFSLSPDGQYLFFARRDRWLNPRTSDIYWVDIHAVVPDSNGSIQNLNSEQCFSSIKCAINYANDGDTIVMSPGVYKESIDLTGKTVSLQSVDPNDPSYIGGTIIQGSADSPVITLQENSAACEIAGLTIRAGSIGIKGTATNAIIRNCRIMDNTNHGLELSRASEPQLLNCLITANGQTGITMLAGSGRNNNCKPNIENCIIVDNGQANIVGGEPVIIDSIVSQ